MPIHPYKVILTILVMLPIWSLCYGEIAFDAASSVTPLSLTSPVTWSHTVAGSETLLFVGVILKTPLGGTISGVTYNGTSMTLIDSLDGNNIVSNSGFKNSIYYLVAPAAGSNTVSVSFTGTGASAAGGSISLTGVHQTNPLDNHACNGSTTGDASVTITPVYNRTWALDNVDIFSGTPTAGASQTARWNNAFNSGSTIGPIRPPAATTFSWTGLTAGWVDCAATFVPSVGYQLDVTDDPMLLLMTGRD